MSFPSELQIHPPCLGPAREQGSCSAWRRPRAAALTFAPASPGVRGSLQPSQARGAHVVPSPGRERGAARGLRWPWRLLGGLQPGLRHSRLLRAQRAGRARSSRSRSWCSRRSPCLCPRAGGEGSSVTSGTRREQDVWPGHRPLEDRVGRRVPGRHPLAESAAATAPPAPSRRCGKGFRSSGGAGPRPHRGWTAMPTVGPGAVRGQRPSPSTTRHLGPI